MADPTPEEVAAARATLRAHDEAEQRRQTEDRRAAARELAAAKQQLLGDVVALWPLAWEAGGERSPVVSAQPVPHLYLGISVVPAGYSVHIAGCNGWPFTGVKRALPDAVDALRAGLRDVGRRLVDAAEKAPMVVTVDLSNGADVPKEG